MKKMDLFSEHIKFYHHKTIIINTLKQPQKANSLTEKILMD